MEVEELERHRQMVEPITPNELILNNSFGEMPKRHRSDYGRREELD